MFRGMVRGGFPVALWFALCVGDAGALEMELRTWLTKQQKKKSTPRSMR